MSYKSSSLTWIIILVVIVSILSICVLFYAVSSNTSHVYDDDDYTELKDENERLGQEIAALTSENETLTSEKETLTSDNETLTEENTALSEKAEWFDTSCKIVIADSGDLYNTYHTYGCDKWRGHSIWIYNKEQVVNNSNYTKCYSCN